MANYFTQITTPTPTAAQPEVFIPFVARIRVTPDRETGKRMSYVRNLEKLSKITGLELEAAGFNIATPVAFTPQFGNYEAHLTIVGFKKQTNRDNTAPTTNIDIISSGTDVNEKTQLINGNRGGSLSEAQDPIDVVTQEVLELRDALVAAVTQFDINDVIHIEYNGVKYGFKKYGGRSFQL